MVLRFIKERIFGNSIKKVLGTLYSTLDQINNLEDRIKILSDDELKAKTIYFKKSLKKECSLESILPEAFAVIRETAKRVLGERHYDVQVLGALVLHQGMIAEMKTGEGKTLASSLAIYLNALTGKGVHVVTVNDYLAKRDSEWMGRIYKFHGLNVACLLNNTPEAERKKIYNADIIYGTNNEFGFDYLRDNLKHDINSLVQREFNFAIIDEVDSILIDEARTPLIISGSSVGNIKLFLTINHIVDSLTNEDYEIDEKNRAVFLTDKGNEKCEKLIKKMRLINEKSDLYDVDNMFIVHHLNQALRAHKVFKSDIDYIVKEDKIFIIDEFSGRIMEGRRYSDGLHQAIEAKEKVTIQQDNQTLASITFQNYFRMYNKLAGMTGTAMTEATEFLNTYNLEVVQIPTHRPVMRVDEDDVIYKTKKAKYNAIVSEIEKFHNKNQPILIGTISIENSEKISNLLKKKQINHNVLNAKSHKREADIIAQAGQLGAVTIATNMAGRGTDIQLGGNAEIILKTQRRHNIKQEDVLKVRKKVEEDRKKVLEIGGLYVIGTERHESRRIDDQLRGRAGRQGDFGRTKFFLSLEDDLMRIFGSDKIGAFLTKLGLEEDEAIEHPWINKALQKAQKKIEARNYEIRKSILKFDDVVNNQRKIVYTQRVKIMQEKLFDDILEEKLQSFNQKIVDQFLPEDTYSHRWKLLELENEVHKVYGIYITFGSIINKNSAIDELNCQVKKLFKNKKEQLGQEIFNQSLKKIFLISLDNIWQEHINMLDTLRAGINLRAYGQKDPLNEYKFEAFQLFESMFDNLEVNIISAASRIQILNNMNNNPLVYISKN